MQSRKKSCLTCGYSRIQQCKKKIHYLQLVIGKLNLKDVENVSKKLLTKSLSISKQFSDRWRERHQITRNFDKKILDG